MERKKLNEKEKFPFKVKKNVFLRIFFPVFSRFDCCLLVAFVSVLQFEETYSVTTSDLIIPKKKRYLVINTISFFGKKRKEITDPDTWIRCTATNPPESMTPQIQVGTT